MSNKGILAFPPLLILGVTALLGLIILKNGGFTLSKPIPANPSQAVETETPAPLSSSTPEPSPKDSPSPIPSLIPTASPKSTPAPVSGPPGSGYSTITVATAKGNFSASVLSLDLASARVITDTMNDSDCSDNCPVTTLADFVNRNGGFAGVNGTYFCPDTYPECSSKKNTFDFPVYNSRLNKWINGGNLFWDSRSMVYFDGGGAHYKQNAKDFGGGLSAGIVNHPGLLDGGSVQIDDNQSGLSDKQRAVGTKVGIGIRGGKNVMVVIARNVNMQQFAHVFKSLGADSALNLDTGGSTALYFNGRYLAGPGRNLPNAIIFAR
ncbi:MAG: phosphodiester glycosidase family protein [bacterium]|nr:phosphodiester glycosidase family protein [bacterium]